jgi:preprotein translocase subunit SecD
LYINNLNDLDRIYASTKKGIEYKSIDTDNPSYILYSAPEIPAHSFAMLSVSEIQDYKPDILIGVRITLNENGADKFAALTERNIGKRLHLVINKTVLSSTIINDRIASGQVLFFVPKKKFDRYFVQ